MTDILPHLRFIRMVKDFEEGGSGRPALTLTNPMMVGGVEVKDVRACCALFRHPSSRDSVGSPGHRSSARPIDHTIWKVLHLMKKSPKVEDKMNEDPQELRQCSARVDEFEEITVPIDSILLELQRFELGCDRIDWDCTLQH